ncbi:MAG TPA: FAD-dependent oxidoreductase [Candidatus Limnocylindrales bacterium]|jgi:4-methylaminobutanoate oxidase (formaldehyde-forming)|nr:FAD-dependent oxidoreductase [Candidatus Limnocylindrales bacterium]
MADHARAVIIGGGVGGTSIAYHLAELGWTDIVLVDRAELTSGSTFHSAGLVGQLRSSVSLTKMMMYGADLYRRLAAETGTDPSWHEVGSLRLASSKARFEELQRQVGWARTFGLPLELISASGARDRFPLMTTDGVLGAVWLPTDGWLDPSGLAQALAAGARRRGAAIRTHTRVVGIGVERGRVTGVDVQLRDGSRETLATGVVVNAAGMFAPEIGRLAGVDVPIIPMAHQYLFTEALKGVHAGLPQLRDPDNLVYFREEVGGLCMGGYERNPAPWSLDGIPADFNGKLLAPDWPRFEEIMAGAIRRVPAIADAGVSRMINGPEAFTPDNEFILGESEVRGFFVAAGFCAHGIAGAGGIGRQVASWIVEGEPELDLWKMDIRRFGAHYRSQSFTLARTTEVYGTYYDIHYPNEERQAGRPLRLSPTYSRLGDLGAVFGEKSGWERPNWFTANESPALDGLRPRGWAGEHWSTAIGAEAIATRETAALFDESSFAKIEIAGPGACAFLQELCANDIDQPVGTIVYTSLLNRRGGIECDLTVTRATPDRFLMVTGTAYGQHDLGWLRRHDPGDGSILITDLTSGRVCFGLWGPRARDILASLTRDDVSNAAFPYLTARALTVGAVPVYALRVSYVGELGWELYAPTEFGAALWDALWEAGREHGLVAGGYRAIDALRLEKGYRVWSSDITPDETPFEAGLGFAVALDKGDFIGREALVRAKEAGPRKRLRCLVLDDPRSVCLGNEPVRMDGDVVGRVTSGGYGFAVERSIAYAYLPPSAAIGDRGEIDVFGEWIGFEVTREPLWDPTGERIRS